MAGVTLPTIPPLDRLAAICTAHSVTWEAVRGKGQTAWITRARLACMKALRDEYGMGCCDIGRVLDRDHSTVLYHLGRRT